MSDYEMRNFGFVTLDASVQCVITGGDSEYGVLGDIIQDLLNGLASKMGKAGFLVAMLAKNIDSFLDGFRDGWNK
ncbi:MAG TPA: hypothetical protein PLM86_03885 [Bacteroidales bacterium]|nr:MAG: hypothetical protein BWX93_00351 [Bacteroidetes bacterium ADurb.Bin139]HOG25311.1 hypothetical protein [Bacteroidales bacterium]HOR11573.1 hypothetical protein [Bacteroidales bacterium]HOZ19771.1 hypothetical protein [Bacteroidales bacterium]HPB77204.1 hypothetical protein [Bacteroidales bacterium]